MKFFLSLVILFLNMNFGFCSDLFDVEDKKDIFYNSENSSENNIEPLILELKNITNKIETLEHNFHIVQKKLEILEKILREQKISTDVSIKSSENSLKEEKNIFAEIESKQELSDKKIEEGKISKIDDKKAILAKELYDAALIEFKEGKKLKELNKLKEAEAYFIKSQQKFENFLQNYEGHSLQGRAFFWYASCYYERRLFNEAAKNYLTGYKKFPKSEKAAESLLKAAMSFKELKEKNGACKILKILETLPEKPASVVNNASKILTNLECEKK